MSVLCCAECGRFIDTDDCPETYREKENKWICEPCWVVRDESPIIPTRPRCQMCHKRMVVEYKVPNDVWRAAVHPHWHNGILCIDCFAEGADEKGIMWSDRCVTWTLSLAAQRLIQQRVERLMEKE